MSGEAVEAKPISWFVGAKSKPSRSGSATLVVRKGMRGEYPEDDRQTRGSNSLNSATHS